jgi:hypothetical protein
MLQPVCENNSASIDIITFKGIDNVFNAIQPELELSGTTVLYINRLYTEGISNGPEVSTVF